MGAETTWGDDTATQVMAAPIVPLYPISQEVRDELSDDKTPLTAWVPQKAVQFDAPIDLSSSAQERELRSDVTRAGCGSVDASAPPVGAVQDSTSSIFDGLFNLEPGNESSNGASSGGVSATSARDSRATLDDSAQLDIGQFEALPPPVTSVYSQSTSIFSGLGQARGSIPEPNTKCDELCASDAAVADGPTNEGAASVADAFEPAPGPVAQVPDTSSAGWYGSSYDHGALLDRVDSNCAASPAIDTQPDAITPIVASMQAHAAATATPATTDDIRPKLSVKEITSISRRAPQSLREADPESSHSPLARPKFVRPAPPRISLSRPTSSSASLSGLPKPISVPAVRPMAVAKPLAPHGRPPVAGITVAGSGPALPQTPDLPVLDQTLTHLDTRIDSDPGAAATRTSSETVQALMPATAAVGPPPPTPPPLLKVPAAAAPTLSSGIVSTRPSRPTPPPLPKSSPTAATGTRSDAVSSQSPTVEVPAGHASPAIVTQPIVELDSTAGSQALERVHAESHVAQLRLASEATADSILPSISSIHPAPSGWRKTPRSAWVTGAVLSAAGAIIVIVQLASSPKHSHRNSSTTLQVDRATLVVPRQSLVQVRSPHTTTSEPTQRVEATSLQSNATQETLRDSHGSTGTGDVVARARARTAQSSGVSSQAKVSAKRALPLPDNMQRRVAVASDKLHGTSETVTPKTQAAAPSPGNATDSVATWDQGTAEHRAWMSPGF